MRSIVLCCLLLAEVFAWAGDIKYPVASIPENLKKNANAVKRFEEVRFELNKLDDVIYKRKVALTILNEAGSRYAVMVAGYDKLRKITSLEGVLYDASGNVLKRSKTKDVQDFSAIQNISLFDDNRMKVLDFNYNIYPYTVEYELEIKMNNSYGFVDWMPQNDENLSVEKSSYTIVTPADYAVRYKTFNYKKEPVITSMEKNRKSMVWSVSALPAIKKPFASPPWNELTTSVFFSPSEFEMEGYKGNANSWEELGKFALALNQGRDKLPDDITQKINDITKGTTDEKEKVKLLYDFLQKNTRYISIQLGIGGLQPFEASFVAKKGYGDCKALSNYMFSLLKSAGIKSYYTLVRAGRDMDDKYLVEDFPSDQFNHIILAVPFAKDTMWLECTSQTESAGYMGGFTGNRKALMITENGGKLVSTPRYALNENRQKRTATGKIEADGTLQLKLATVYSGIQQDHLNGLVNLSKDKVKEYLQEELQLATYEVNDFKYNEKKGVLPQLDEHLDITVKNYSTVTGKRLFIMPNILSRGGMKLSEEERKADFVFDYEFHNEDEYEIEIPEGYEIEAMPKDVSVKTKFGLYSSTTKFIGNKIIYKRVREQYSGRFPASDQPELIKFFDDIYKSDRSRMVLVKK